MKRATLTLIAGLTAAIAMPAHAGEIVRHTNPPSIILSGVTIPPDAELLMLSGMTPSPIAAGKTEGFEAFGDTKTQAISVFQKIKASLEKTGYDMKDMVKLTVFLVGDPKLNGKMDFNGFNDAYKAFFGTAANPNLIARSTFQIVALANPYYLVEVEATAAKVPAK